MSNAQETLERFRSIVVVNAERLTLEISQKFRKLTPEQQRSHFGGHFQWGFTWLYSDPSHPDKVMETVVSPYGDAITSLYIASPPFGSLGDLQLAREALIRAIADRIGLSIEAIGIEDPGRGREVSLAELSTGQLVDILAERMGASLMVTNSYGGDSDLTPDLASV